MLSCSTDSETVNPSDSSAIVTFKSDISTRVDFGGFEQGDIISVAAYSGSTALTTNTLYEYNNYLIFESETPIEYESADQELTFTAIYPSREGSIMSFDFEAAVDQSVDDAYEMSDLLVSKSEPTTERQPELLFNHVMSNVVINIISSESFDDATMTLQAINTATCNLSAETYVAKGSSTTITAAVNSGVGLKAIVAPQTIAANTTFATLTVNGKVYTWTTLEEMTFESGRQYSFNWDLAINEVSATGIINGWGDSTSDAGTDIAYTRLSDYSATSYPESAETWVIYDIYASTDNFDGLQAALNAVSGSTTDTREISLEFPNLLQVPSDALESSTSTSSSVKTTCLKRVSLPKATLIKYDAFRYCQYLETLITPELTVIESYAFGDCSALNAIDVSKVISVGDSAFYYCNTILSITFDSLVDVGSYAFRGMSNLVSISLPKAEVLGSNALYSCTNLLYVDIPNVRTIDERTFGSCSSLISISIPKLSNAYGSSNVSYQIFGSCGNMRYMTISTEATLNSCRYLFAGLTTSLITLTVGKENAAYVNGDVFTTFDTSGNTTDYTFYEIIIED